MALVSLKTTRFAFADELLELEVSIPLVIPYDVKSHIVVAMMCVC